MRHQICYAGTSFTGLVRKNNEDNYSIEGNCRQPDEADREELLTGTIQAADRPYFAVFDGMGGESKGEMASYIAAREFNRSMERKALFMEILFPVKYIRGNCREMNRAVLQYAEEHKIRSMGTTAAILYFTGNRVILANLGDSRIYRFRGKEKGMISSSSLKQMSEDHVIRSELFRKGPITQYLGMPETESMIDPLIQEEAAEAGTTYLICSDGLTDMLSDQDIGRIMEESETPEEAVASMKTEVLANGGIDNTTIIICRII